MELELTAEEASILHRVLTSYLGDLRMEIANTDRLEWREALHRDENSIKSLLARLETPTAE